MSTRTIPRRVKRLIRQRVAESLAQMAEEPSYVEGDVDEVQEAWREYVHEIAKQIGNY